MYFRQSREMDNWFKELPLGAEYPFKTKLERYYFCALLGLAMRLKEEIDDPVDIIDRFTDDLKPYRDLVLALLLHVESNLISLEPSTVAATSERLFSPDDPARLSKEGKELLNRYAHAGFLRLKQEMSKPVTYDEFFRHYLQIIDKIFESKKNMVIAQFIPPFSTSSSFSNKSSFR